MSVSSRPARALSGLSPLLGGAARSGARLVSAGAGMSLRLVRHVGVLSLEHGSALLGRIAAPASPATAATAAHPSPSSSPAPPPARGADGVEDAAPGTDGAGTAAVVYVPEPSSGSASDAFPEPVVPHSELPVPDFDHMTLGSLRGRLRSLSLEDLRVLHRYESEHAQRLPILVLLENRIGKVSSGEAVPSGRASQEPAPEQRSRPAGRSKVSLATQAPPRSAPPLGVPGNPHDPR